MKLSANKIIERLSALLFGLLGAVRATWKLRRKYTKTFPETICERVSDGTLWVASSNGVGAAMLALFGKGDRFFFRRIHRLRDGWIGDFDNIWQFNDGSMFEMRSKREHKIWVRRDQWRQFLATP